mgnify:FL=1
MIEVFPKNLVAGTIIATYIKNLEKVVWGYNVIGSNALYDATNSKNFELHRSEESALVVKILALAGITLNKPGLVQIGTQMDQVMENKQKQ